MARTFAIGDLERPGTGSERGGSGGPAVRPAAPNPWALPNVTPPIEPDLPSLPNVGDVVKIAGVPLKTLAYVGAGVAVLGFVSWMYSMRTFSAAAGAVGGAYVRGR